jgi:capsular polysaccharide biosynthesis protein
MGVREHVHYKEPVYTKKLIFSCRAPLVHPYTTQRASELFGVDILKTPMKERKIVLYLSRKEDISNSGRDVKNEADLLDALRKLLKERDQEEELVVFDRRKYKSVEALVEYMSGSVRAMIGPHGSAFHNARFASKHTLLVEFMVFLLLYFV